MNCYFLSDIPAHLKINGEYKGVVCKNLSYLTVNNGALFEFLPLNTAYYSVYSTQNSKNLKIYNFYNDKVLYPIFTLKNCHPFKVLSQKTKSYLSYNVKVTLVSDGCVKFFIDGSLYDIKSLPFIPKDFDVSFNNDYLFLSFTGEKTALFVYNFKSNSLCFSDIIDSFYVSNVLTVKKEYQTVTKTTINEEWDFSNDFKLISRRDEKARQFFDLNKELIALAFIENAVIGASVKEICTPSFNEKLSSLKEFLGKVIKAFPSPKNPSEVIIMYENFLSIVKIEYENRLINNILIEDLDN